MSVEKLSGNSKVKQEPIPFTQICNMVINNIKDGDSFLVWAYLQSKTADWKVIKQDIKNNYKFGNTKLKNIFSYLHRAKLIEYVRMHSANGTIARWDIQVLSGNKFDKNQQFKECATTGSENHPLVNQAPGFGKLLNKDITKQRKKQNTKNLSASHDAQPTANKSFDEFWKIYPIKKNKVRARNIWDKKKLNDIATLVCDDVIRRKREDNQWRDPQYIPHPSTYLHNELWEDDITPTVNPDNKPGSTTHHRQETRSAVPEWGRGHPTWDAMHSKQ